MSIGKNKGPKLYFSQFGGEQPIPPEFIAAMERAEEVQPVPNDVGPEALSGTIIESSVKTDRTDERVRRTIKKKAGNITLSFVNTNDKGQPVQIVKTLFPTGTTPAVPSATQNVAVQNLGNGWSIQEVGVEGSYIDGVFTPGLFSGKTRESGTPVVIPERFRASTGINSTEDIVAGTVPDTLTLGANEIHRKESQVTNFTKRVESTIFNPAAAPTLHGQDYDKQLNFIIRFLEKLEAAGTSLGLPLTQIDPLSEQLDLVRTIDGAAAAVVFDAYVLSFPTTSGISFPDILTSIGYLTSRSDGEGDDTTKGSGKGGNFIHSYFNWSIRSTSRSSHAISRRVFYNIAQISGQFFPTITYLFFLAAPATHAQVRSRLSTLAGAAVQPWPRFVANSQTIVTSGEKKDIETMKSESEMKSTGLPVDGNSSAETHGRGKSFDCSVTMYSTTIPPTIGGFFPLGSTNVVNTNVGVELSSAASHAVVPATPVTTIPTHGLFLLRTNAEPYQYGYVKVVAEVVDMSNLRL